MNTLLKLTLSLSLLLTAGLLHAGAGPGGPVTPGVPINDGLPFLLVAGAAYGIKKYYSKKKKAD